MTYPRSALLASALGLAALALAAPALAQSYGPGDQELTIPAAAFRPTQGTNTGYVYNEAGDGYLFGGGSYYAPVDLPDGAEVTLLCLYAYDTDGSTIFTEAESSSLVVQGDLVRLIDWGSAQINFNVGYGAACSGALSYTIRSTFDNGTGLAHYGHRLYVSMNSNTVGLGGVRIIWHRQVSPAPATASFNDVPATDTGFQFVEALVASGITAGCGGGNYCPDAPLTRRQMAIFLSKALGLHWPN